MAFGVCLTGCCAELETVDCDGNEIIIFTSFNISTYLDGTITQNPGSGSCDHSIVTSFSQDATLLDTPRIGKIASWRSVSPNPEQWDEFTSGSIGSCMDISRPVYLVTIGDLTCQGDGQVRFNAAQYLTLDSTGEPGTGVDVIASEGVTETPAVWNARNGTFNQSNSLTASTPLASFAQCCYINPPSNYPIVYNPTGNWESQCVA